MTARKANGASAPKTGSTSCVIDQAELEEFRDRVLSQGRELYRDLPWRNTRDPYEIWISEVMLQQTQVSRVSGRWERFIGRFPSVDALAAAANADVLEEWQGMGYNRRALTLKRAADICSRSYAGSLPRGYDELVALPSIGPATAAGIRAFAFDEPGVYLETNVRAVFLDRFFPDEDKVTDARIRPLVEAACPREGVRTWYYALLDVGANLKRTQENPTRKAAAYTRQSAFEGSRRQKRAWIVREVMGLGSAPLELLSANLNAVEQQAGRAGVDEAELQSILNDLEREGFLVKNGNLWKLS